MTAAPIPARDNNDVDIADDAVFVLLPSVIVLGGAAISSSTVVLGDGGAGVGPFGKDTLVGRKVFLIKASVGTEEGKIVGFVIAVFVSILGSKATVGM